MLKKRVAGAKDKLKHRLHHNHAPPNTGSSSRHGSKYHHSTRGAGTAVSFSTVDTAAFEQILDDDSDIDFTVVKKAPPTRPVAPFASLQGTDSGGGHRQNY